MPAPPHTVGPELTGLLLRRLCLHIGNLSHSTLVVADAGDPTNRALAPFAIMLTYRRSTTLLARALDAVVVADALLCTLPATATDFCSSQDEVRLIWNFRSPEYV